MGLQTIQEHDVLIDASQNLQIRRESISTRTIIAGAAVFLLAIGACAAVAFGNSTTADSAAASTQLSTPTQLKTTPKLTAVCSLVTNGSAVDAKHTLYGHNQINGPVYNLAFDDSALDANAKALWSGMLRYPGGTVANYWYWNDANFITPCKGDGPFKAGPSSSSDAGQGGVAVTSTTEDYDYCNKQASVAKYPSQTWSPSNFVKGVGGASPVQSKDGHMWLINCLTATSKQMQNQLYNLQKASQTDNFPVKFLEFGNEFYMGEYRPWFPDDNSAGTYIDNIKSALQTARRLFPDAKIGVPFAYHFCDKPEHNKRNNPRFNNWNDGLAKSASLFDAVTIHDYTACTGSVDTDAYDTKEKREMALAAWGDASIDEQRHYVASYGLGDKEIWQTEWNYATWMGFPFSDMTDFNAETVANGAITGIFHASYGLKFVESWARADKSLPFHTAANHHLFNQQEGQGWGSNCGYSNTAADGGMSGSSVNGAGQIFSHLSYVALHLSDTMQVVSANQHCGTSPISILMGRLLPDKTDINCLYATAHTHTCRKGALPIYMVINRCNNVVNTHVDTSNANSGKMRISSYTSDQEGPWTPISNLEGNYAHPWTNGPLKPTVSTTTITPDSEYGQRVALPAISFSVIEFSQAGYSSSHVAKGCPTIEF